MPQRNSPEEMKKRNEAKSMKEAKTKAEMKDAKKREAEKKEEKKEAKKREAEKKEKEKREAEKKEKEKREAEKKEKEKREAEKKEKEKREAEKKEKEKREAEENEEKKAKMREAEKKEKEKREAEKEEKKDKEEKKEAEKEKKEEAKPKGWRLKEILNRALSKFKEIGKSSGLRVSRVSKQIRKISKTAGFKVAIVVTALAIKYMAAQPDINVRVQGRTFSEEFKQQSARTRFQILYHKLKSLTANPETLDHLREMEDDIKTAIPMYNQIVKQKDEEGRRYLSGLFDQETDKYFVPSVIKHFVQKRHDRRHGTGDLGPSLHLSYFTPADMLTMGAQEAARWKSREEMEEQPREA